MELKHSVLIALNAGLIVLFIYLWRKKNLLSSFQGGKWYLSWLAVAIITLMDELTSIFYAPAEAHANFEHYSHKGFSGIDALVFIAGTSLLIRFLSTRMTEIARILEKHGIRGGGVYSFSYLVLGPVVSFVAVASIFVDYILTACISTVSAVSNALSMMGGPGQTSGVAIFVFQLAIVWGVCMLNIIGIKENARFTFMVFTAAALILLTLMAAGVIQMPAEGWATMGKSFTDVGGRFGTDSLSGIGRNLIYIVIGVSSCILAYSGIESVVQTAGLVRDWHDIRRAYLFLGLTVGFATPIISALVLSYPGLDIKAHEGDLITHFGKVVMSPWFGVLVGALASFTLTMAVNTAYVASAELIERVAHRYGFHWIIQHNKRGSLYRIHLSSAVLYTVVILITQGSQSMLAQMYAVGLVASFVINMGALLIYRYRKGALVEADKPQEKYHTSRTGTLIIFLLLLGCLIFLAITKPFGLAMWATFTLICLVIGLLVARKREPEIARRQQTDTPMELILYLAENADESMHVYFRRPQEDMVISGHEAYVSFFSPRQGDPPPSRGPGHFRFSLEGITVFNAIRNMIDLIKYEMPDQNITFHFGWPLSSWFDRLSTGVMVYSLMVLPKKYPNFNFVIEHTPRNQQTQQNNPGA